MDSTENKYAAYTIGQVSEITGISRDRLRYYEEKGLLFSAYHLFSPWEFFTRIIVCLPFVYCVYKKKNIYIGMIVHCTLNTASVIMAVLSLLK